MVLEQVDSEENSWNATPVAGLPRGLRSKESACSAAAAGDVGLIAGWGWCPGEGHSNPLQYSCLENSMDRGAWWATVHGDPKSRTRLKRLSMHTHTPGGTCWKLALWNLPEIHPWACWGELLTRKCHQRHCEAKPSEGFSRGSCWPLRAAGCCVLEGVWCWAALHVAEGMSCGSCPCWGTGPHRSSFCGASPSSSSGVT